MGLVCECVSEWGWCVTGVRVWYADNAIALIYAM